MALVVLCESDMEFVSRLDALIDREEELRSEKVRGIAELRTFIEERQAVEVVVFGPSVPIEEALDVAESLGSRTPPIMSLLVARNVTSTVLRNAMRAGLRDVLEADNCTYGDVITSIQDARQTGARMRTADEGAPVPKVHAKTVAVFSTKGGVGKTVVASNLGVALAQLGKNTVLVDLDLQFGDAGVMLGLEPKRTIYDAALASDRLDVEMLKGFLIEHSSGLKALLAPVRPEEAESVTTARLSRIVDLLREMFDVVILDTAGTFDDTVLSAIDRSDQVLAIATMDVPSIKNTKVSLQKLKQLGYRNGMVKLVLNRADSKVLLEPGEVEKAIGGTIVAKVPSDRMVPRSVNKGVPVTLDAPKSPVARSIVGLAEYVAQDE